MPKKKSSKTPKEVQENAVKKGEKPNAVIKKEKPSSVQKSSEIDEIFAGKKRKKPEVEKAEKLKLDASDRPKKMKNEKKNETQSKDGGLADRPSRPRKTTGDGLAIYTEEELGIGSADAGGTPLCPFDCSCCF